MVKIAGREFSALAAAKARENLARKIAGKRIGRQNPFNPSIPLSEQQFDEASRAFTALVSIPANRRALIRGNIAKARATELGFKSVEEAQQLRKFAKPKPRIQSIARREDLITKTPSVKTGVISAVEQEKGLAGVSQKLRGRLGKLTTKELRGDLTEREKIKQFFLVLSLLSAEGIEGVKSIPETLRLIKKDPTILKNIPTALATSVGEFSEVVRTSPATATGVIAGQVIVFKGTGTALRILSKLSKAQLTKLDPKFIGKLKTGKSFQIPTGGGKSVNIEVVGKIPTQTLREQAKLAGTTPVGISTQADKLLGVLNKTKKIRKPIPGEADFSPAIKRLLAKFDSGKISKLELIKLDFLIRKTGAKGLLERAFFIDPSGKIRPSRLGIFGERIRLTKAERQRIFNLEKKKKLTPSQQERLFELRARRPFTVESLVDKFTTSPTFRSKKPQILLFDKIQVEKFPKSLASVKKKLATGGTLTKSETNALLKFQLKQSGKAKPVGFVSKEAEITLAPGEILQKQKTLATTIINGKRIPIIKTTIFKPKGQTKILLDKFKKGGLTSKQKVTLNKLEGKKRKTPSQKLKIKTLNQKKGLSNVEQKKLDRLLKKQTGFDYGVSSSVKSGKKFVSVRRLGLSGLLTSARKGRPSKPSRPSKVSRPSRPPKKPSKPSKPGKPSKPSKVGRPSKPSKVSPPSRPPKRPPIRPPGRPGKIPPIIPGRLKKIRRVKKKKKRQQAYNVLARPRKKKGAKKRPKLIKINKVPLTRIRAKDLRNFIADDSLARTSRIKKVKGKPQPPRLKVPKGFAKKTQKKFRTFRIVKGKRKALPKGKVIERRSFLLDRKNERLQIGLRRRVSLLTKQSRKPLTASQLRVVQLRNLQKARRVRMVNLKNFPTQKRKIVVVSKRKSNRPVRINMNQNRVELLKRLKKARAVRMSNLKKKKKR